MKNLLLIALIFTATTVIAQDYQVLWSSPLEGFEKILKFDDDGFYCYSFDKMKRKTIAPSLIKYDYNLKEVFNTEISISGAQSYLTGFFALKNHFAFITRIDENKSSDYYATLINNEGASSTPVKVFTTHKPTNYPSNAYESTELFSFASEDSTHLLFFSNFPQLGKAIEKFEFAVFTNNLTPAYRREVTLNLEDDKTSTYEVLLSKKNKLITYNVFYEKNRSEIYKSSRGEFIPLIKYYLNIYGQSPEEDKEFQLSQDKYKFINNFMIKSLPNGKLYLIALCANNPENYAQAIMVCEVDEVNLTINLKYYPFEVDLIEKINKMNTVKTNKKYPGISNQAIIDSYLSKDGNLNVVLENSGYGYKASVVAFEVKNDKLELKGSLEKSQTLKYGLVRFNMSVFDFVHNNILYLVYNDLDENLNANKIKEFDADKDNASIFLATLAAGSFSKGILAKEDKQGYVLNTRKSKSSGDKVILVRNNLKEEKVKLGVLKIK